MNNDIINRVTKLSENAGKKPTICMIAAGVGKDFFTHLRKGQKPSIEKIAKLADYFNVTTDYILGRSDIMKEAALGGGRPLGAAVADLINHAHKLSEGEAADVLKYIEFIHSKRSDGENEDISNIDYFKPEREKSSKKI